MKIEPILHCLLQTRSPLDAVLCGQHPSSGIRTSPFPCCKDTYHGDFDTSELESAWDVDVFDTGGRIFGWGMIKLEPLVVPTGERLMVLDSDVLFLGPRIGYAWFL